MKKIFSLSIFILLSKFSLGQKVTFQSILTDILNGAKQIQEDQVLTPQSIYNQSIIVNSVSNADFSGGQCRRVIKLNIPRNTVKWYYRITVLDVNQKFSYPPNETLFYNLVNKKSIAGFYTNDISMNFFVMNNSGDQSNFLLSRPHSYIPNSSNLKSNSTFGISDIISENLWLGVENMHYTKGANVIIEIVAYTRALKVNPQETIQSKKQMSEAKELFELGVIDKNQYDSIFRVFSPKLTREEALIKLKEAKTKLDLGQLSQIDYDNLLKIYRPIIQNKQ